MANLKEINHCILCGAIETKVLSDKDRKGKPLRTVICIECGLVRSDPIPSAEEIQRFYALDYRQDYMHTYEPTLRLVHRAGINAIQRWRDLQNVLLPGQQILDVGAGGGEFVFLLRYLGWEAVGIEPNKGYGNYAAQVLGVPIKAGFAEDIEVVAESYDVITLYHILEHFRDPRIVLRRVHQWLRPDGLAIVEVPNVEAVCQSPDHRFHHAHLYNFNAATLESLCRQVGFQLQRTWWSDDGGNVTLQLCKGSDPLAEPVALDGNYQRITSVLKHHTKLNHYTSRYPYQRPMSKLVQYAREFWETRKAVNGRELLLQMMQQLKPDRSTETLQVSTSLK